MRQKFTRKKPTSFTPDLLAYLLKDHIEKDFARHEEQLSNRQRFNLLLFYAWSYFSGTCTHVRFKGANPGAIKEALRESLVEAAAFIQHERIRKIAGKASLLSMKRRGRSLFATLDDILQGIGTSTPAQLAAAGAFESAVFQDGENNVLRAHNLYRAFWIIDEIVASTVAKEVFLVDEDDPESIHEGTTSRSR